LKIVSTEFRNAVPILQKEEQWEKINIHRKRWSYMEKDFVENSHNYKLHR
jgi:hypothetical protein